MKVLLIAANVAKTPYPVYPLGMGMIARATLSAGHEVAQFDYLSNDMSLDAVAKCVDGFKPDVVGISIRNIDNVNLINERKYIHVVKDLVDAVNGACDAKVVLGGSGYSFFPESILELSGADYGITGEGEVLFVRLLDDIKSGIRPAGPVISRDKDMIEGANIPSALYDKKIMKAYLKSGNVASVQTKRGCAHKCIYCSYPFLEGSNTRARDPEEVVDDIETLINEHDAKMIFFTDSIFNDDQGEYLKVLNAMKRRNVSVPWTAFFTPADIDVDTLALMKKTGLKAVELGSDAPSNSTLRGIAKSFTFADIKKCSDLLTSNGIATAHYFMFGCPGETASTVQEGIDNILSLKDCVSFIFMGIRILPGTALEKKSIQDGIIASDQNLLESAYYIAPGINHGWLEEKLNEAFKDVRNCMFPPDVMEESVQFLHKMGYTGLLWDMLIKEE